MRTTLNIDDQLLTDAQTAANAKTRTQLIEMGLRALIDQAARKRLAALAGAIPEAATPPRRRIEASQP